VRIGGGCTQRVLVVSREEATQERLSQLLVGEGYEALWAKDARAGIAIALTRLPNLIVCDLAGSPWDGHHLLRVIRNFPETARTPLLFLLDGGEPSYTPLGLEADSCFSRPLVHRELLAKVRLHTERQTVLSGVLSSGRSAPEDHERPIVCSPLMRALYGRAELAAERNLGCLLLGEAGVGKSVLAYAIHRASRRAQNPFIPVDCAALPQSLVEAELFGQPEGARAKSGRESIFEAARGGTVFLANVDALPPLTQAKLLSFLETEPATARSRHASSDDAVALVAAATLELGAASTGVSLRSDLLQRIAEVTLTLPPLRERPEEVVPLAEAFARNVCMLLGIGRVPVIPSETRQLLMSYAWPQNISELRRAIEQAIMLDLGDTLEPEHLPTRLRTRSATSEPPGSAPVPRLSLRVLERRRILDALEECGGNQSRAAILLGISRGTLLSRLSSYEVPRPRKRAGDQ
jgi:two-component system response regulator AtoC